MRHGSTRAGTICTAVLIAEVSVMALAQAITPPFGATEATARRLLVESLANGGFPVGNGTLVHTVRRALDKMPVAARGPATTAAFAWVKSYVQSPAFAAAWAAARDERKPEGVAPQDSVDVEAKKIIDTQLAAVQQSREILATLNMSPAAKAKNLAKLQMEEDEIKNPLRFKQLRDSIVLTRGAVAADASDKFAKWEETYPADVKVMIKRALKTFLDNTATVDFSIPTIWLKNAAGETLGFLSPGYTGLSWDHEMAIVAGKEALAAARVASEAWLKELGGR